jgi:hypothetical protein
VLRAVSALVLALATSASAADYRTSTHALRPENRAVGSAVNSAEHPWGARLVGQEMRWRFFSLSREVAVDESIFAYANGNPTNLTDPAGTAPADVECVASGRTDCNIFALGGWKGALLAIRARDARNAAIAARGDDSAAALKASQEADVALQGYVDVRYTLHQQVGLPVTATAFGVAASVGVGAAETGAAIGFYGRALWGAGTAGKVAVIGLGGAGIVGIPGAVNQTVAAYRHCANFSGAGDIGNCAEFGFSAGAAVQPAAELSVAAPGFIRDPLGLAPAFHEGLESGFAEFAVETQNGANVTAVFGEEAVAAANLSDQGTALSLANALRSRHVAAGGVDVDIALGLSKTPEHPALLNNFAEQVGGLHYWQWEEAGLGRWQGPFEPFFQQATQRARSIKFNLTGLDVERALRVGPEGFTKTGQVTGAELTTILKNPALLRKTIFYRNGAIAPAPRLP